jgi:hypothetical protein
MSNLPTPINLNDTTPASPNGEVLVKWQGDNANPRNVSACVPYSSATEAGAILNVGDIGGTGENPTVEGLLGIEITEAPSADGQVLQFVADGVSDAGVAFGSLKFSTVTPTGLPIPPAVYINSVAVSYEPYYFFNTKPTLFNGA